MRRLLVNDCLTCIPGTRTFWHDLMEWFDMEFVGGDYRHLASDQRLGPSVDAGIIIRNATWFGPLRLSASAPTISLLQDIMPDGESRKMQEAVIKSSRAVVFNSEFTKSKYTSNWTDELKQAARAPVIPLPVDFSLFEPGNALGLQQALSLPDGAVCWIGASLNSAGHVKGYDVFLGIVRANPDIPFVGVFKDAAPEYGPPNLRTYTRLTHDELVKVIGACRVGLCTSRTESQHLAGIEMGACGLPMVAPPVGVYWKGRFGVTVTEPTVPSLTAALRQWLLDYRSAEIIREAWSADFDRPVIKAAWAKLIEGVECAARD